jgi:hypothetical protein
MRRIKTMGLCFVTALALSALAEASASAKPYVAHLFLECAKASPKDSGQYTSKACTPASKVETGGAYELGSAVGEEFTSKAKTTTIYGYIPSSETERWKGGSVILVLTCKKSAGSGEIVSSTSSTWTFTLEDCSFEGKKCTSAGEVSGDVETFPLRAVIRLEQGKVVSVATPVAGPEAPLADANCEGISEQSYGAVIGEVTADIESASGDSKETLTADSSSGAPGLAFYEEGVEGEEGKQTLALVETHFTPPDVTLPLGINMTQEFKSKNAVGIYPQNVL